MKKLSLIISVLLLLLVACEKDETMIMLSSYATPPKITSQAAGFTQEITQTNLGSELKFDWSKTGYGVSTEVTYTLQVDSKCNTFAAPVVIGTTTATTFSITLDNLNARLVNDLKIAPHQLSQLQLRVISTINNNHLTISDAVPVTIKPWSDKPTALWMGDNSTAAPFLFATNESVYEGYEYMAAGTSFRFATNPVCSDVVFGDAGSGKLVAGATAARITVAESGYYKFNADTKGLTYEITPIATWGMIGTATPGGWDASTPLTYNKDNGLWETQLVLTTGALKFRANDEWVINYGTSHINASEDSLVFDAPAIDIAEQGNYKVSLDFTQSKAPYKYTYSVIKTGDITEPTKVWLPGSYQNWSPSTAPFIYAINGNEYEGYLNLTTGAGFKFTTSPDWDHINYGEAGTGRVEAASGTGGSIITGNLTTDGLKDGVSLNDPAYYRLKINTANLTYRIDKISSWGLIGTSTTGAWDNSTAMTYDATNNVWKVTANLVPGALKFRANNAWDMNYGVGDINATEGSLVFDAASANISEAGSYTVMLDFSKSKAPYQYTYSIKKN